MQVIINGKTYEVVDGNYYLVATYDLARQIGGLDPGEHGNELIRAGFVSEAGCRIKSSTVIPDYYTGNAQCVLYEDLEVDEDIILDGDETIHDYDYVLYTSSDGNTIVPNVGAWYTSNDGHEIECNHKPTEPKCAVNIPDGAFSGKTTLTSFKTAIKQSIGVSCFRSCTGLKTFEMTGPGTISENAFSGCSNLKTFIMGTYWRGGYGSSEFKIGSSAFQGCSNLTRLQGQDLISNIYSNAFQNCSGLTTLSLIGCTSIGDEAFMNCTNLKRMILKGDATFGDNVFSGCTNIEEVIFLGNAGNNIITKWKTMLNQLYNGLKTEAKNNFVIRVIDSQKDGYKDTSASWNNKIVTYNSEDDIILAKYERLIKDSSGHITSDVNGVWLTAAVFDWLRYNARCFSIFEARNVKNVNIYNGIVTYTGYINTINDAFEYIYDSDDGKHYVLRDFTCFKHFSNVTEIEYGAFKECYYLTAITIPDSVTSIGYSAFEDCYYLTAITIPDSVTSIGYSAFEDCDSLISIELPVENIEESAFYNCRGLTSVMFEGSVTSIGDCAFQNCTGLTTVSIYNLDAEVHEDAFKGCPSSGTVYYPKGEDYENSKYYKTNLKNWTWIGF